MSVMSGANRAWLAFYVFGLAEVYEARARLHELNLFGFGVHVSDPRAFIARLNGLFRPTAPMHA